jgi:RNA polymerase sigma-70 factor (ECF subfamily)
MESTSTSLLRRLRDPRAREAWDRFVQLYAPLLYTWASHMGLQDADAADLVQDVFTVLVQKLPEFAYDRHQSFRGWLWTVTKNKWREHHRRRASRGKEVGDAFLPDAASPDPRSALEEVEYRRHLIARALEVMRDDFQPSTLRACWEHVVVGRPAAEVAAELGMSEGAVYVAKCRVLRKLRQELDGLLE